MSRMKLSAILVFVTAGTAASAADPADATWPCVQRKVERLSAGALWPRALPENPPELNDAEMALAARIALRRVSEEDAADMVGRYLVGKPSARDAEQLGAIFLESFRRIDRDRSRIIDGIERYAAKQLSLASGINGLRAEMAAAMGSEDKDDAAFDRIDALEERLDWSERVFEDRSRALTYVCESPILLEKRAFAIARLLAGQING